MQTTNLDIPRWILATLNNLYEIDRKLSIHGDPGHAQRNVVKLKDLFAEMGFFYDDPMGQAFKETRADLEATITGSKTENLFVTEVIKPIIRCGTSDLSRVVQKGIVLVEHRDEDPTKGG